MADVNGDGIDDLISGSWPGDIFWFPGGADRTFAARETLIEGTPMTAENAPTSRVIRGYTLTQSACVNACDWDADGDIDIIVGTILGPVYLYANAGTAEEPVFGQPVLMTWQGAEDGQFIGHDLHKAGVATGDWDLDGDLDLVVTDERWTLRLYRNVGSPEEPLLAEPETLQLGADGFTEGYRPRPCIADYNADGLPDLIIGNAYSGGEPRRTSGHVWVSLRSSEPITIPEAEETIDTSYLLAPTLVLDGEAPIEVTTGHAHPLFVDWDEDGVRDLLVGQFGEGLLRYYRNHGTAAAPRFAGFTLVQAGGVNASVPPG